LAIGVLSTLSMDVLTGISTWLKLVAPLPPNLVGRWFASVARAQLIHGDISRSSPANYELFLALPVHYAIRTVLAALFVWGTSALGWPRRLAMSIAFWLCISVLPWVLMFPAMGYGFFGAHGPDGTRLFVSS